MSRRRGRLPDPERVLEGRASIDLSGLISLIHQENPSGRELDDATTDARYALKSALQSLLLRRYPEHIRIEADARDPELVAIHCPIDGRDAGHAPVSELDEDVRPWVRSQVALGPDPANALPAAVPVDAKGSRDAIAEAREARDLGEFDSAARIFGRLARSGRLDAATEALELWIDWLGDVDRAAALFAELPRTVQKHPSLRATLATGEARRGRLEAALAHLGDDASGASADAWAAVGAAALDADRNDLVQRTLRHLKVADPAHPRIAELGDALAEVRDRARAPLRQAVTDAWADRDVAQQALSALLDRFPDDAWGQERLRELARARALDEARRVMRLAEQAEQAGDFREAGRLLTKAAAAGIEGLDGQITGLARRAREQKQQAAADALASRLRRALEPRTLDGYARLSGAQRKRVRSQVDHRVLGWVDAFVERGVDPGEASGAALALHRVIDRVPGAEALEALADHPAVSGLAEGRRTLEVSRQAAAHESATRSESAVVQAERFVAEGDLDSAAATLNAVETSALPPVLRDRHEAVAAAIRDKTRRRRHEAEFRRLLDGPVCWRARKLAEERARTDPTWLARVDEAERAVDQAWSVVRIDGGGPMPPRPYWSHLLSSDTPLTWRIRDTRTAVVPEHFGRFAALHTIDLASGRTLATLVFRPPNGSAWAGQLHVRDKIAWMVLLNGVLIGIDLERIRIDRWAELAPDRLQSIRFNRCELFHDTAVAWFSKPATGRHQPDQIDYTHVTVDLDTMLPVPAKTGLSAPRYVPGLEGALSRHRSGRFEVRDRTHRVVRRIPAPSIGPYDVRAVVPLTGDRWLALLRVQSEAVPFHLLEELGRGPIQRFRSWETRLWCLAARPGDGLVFVAEPLGELAGRLHAFSTADGGEVRLLWTVEGEPSLVVGDDRAAGHGMWIPTSEGSVWVELGADPPALPQREPDTLSWEPIESCPICGPRTAAGDEIVRAIEWQGDQATAIAMQRLAGGADPLDVAEALLSIEKPLPDELVTALGDRLDDPFIRQMQAQICAYDDDWHGVLEVLRPDDPGRIEGAEEQAHAWHLLALAHLFLGDSARAVQLIRQVPPGETECNFGAIEEMVRVIRASDGPPTDEESGKVEGLRVLRGAVREADAAVARGAPDEALAVLLRPAILGARNAQLTGRLVQLLLDRPDEPAWPKLRWLGELGEALEHDSDVPMPHPWPQARLKQLESAADAWCTEWLVHRPERQARLVLVEEGGALVLGFEATHVVPDGPWSSVDLLQDPPWTERVAARFALDLGGGDRVELEGDDAVDFLIDRLPKLRERWVVVGQERLVRFARVGAIPKPRIETELGDAPARLALAFELEGQAIPRDQVLDAWLRGERTITLDDGAIARLPLAWLSRHGSALAALRDRGPTPPAWAGFALGDALAGTAWAAPERPVPVGVRARLREYQRAGFSWLASRRDLGLGACLADDMGLGKTLQALVLLRDTYEHRPEVPSLVVAPASVLHTWKAEMDRHVPELGRRAVIHHGPDRATEPYTGFCIAITTYGLLRSDSALQQTRWQTAILDEAQRIKNPEGRTARAAFALEARHRVALTGTPLENDLSELWSLFRFLQPDLLGSLGAFTREVRDDPSAVRERIRPLLLRRTKREVAPELPLRQEVYLQCVLGEDQRATYERIRQSVAAQYAEDPASGILFHGLTRLRQACCHPALLGDAPVDAVGSAKLTLLLEALQWALGDGHKCLVFSQWTRMLDLVQPELERRTWPFLRLDGSTPTSRRAELVTEFSRPEGPPIFLVSLMAGGEGITLTEADYVFFLDPWWNPATERQAADRAHRIGQDKPVTIYRLVARDTVESHVLELQRRKQALFDATIEGEDFARLSPTRLTEAEVAGLFLPGAATGSPL